jgi:L-threonine kinase
MLLQQGHLSDVGIGIGESFGTFGELLQGIGTNDNDFLVTLPINRFSHAEFSVHSAWPGLVVSPSNMYKSKKLAESILKYFGLPMCGFLNLQSNIPIGKGFASSSADLVATTRAIDHYYQLNLTTEQILSFIRNIEPTDGVMYDGSVSFYHRKVQLHKCLGSLPAMTIVSLDEGGQVDTIEFNKVAKSYTAEQKEGYDFLLNEITLAIHTGDLKKIGEISTQSAILNQKLKYKKHLTDAMKICSETGGLGVVVAHSGTCIGILFSPLLPNYHLSLYNAYNSMKEIKDDIEIFSTDTHIPSQR